jgi:hypothetical protein
MTAHQPSAPAAEPRVAPLSLASSGTVPVMTSIVLFAVVSALVAFIILA